MPDPRSLSAYTPPSASDLTVAGDADKVLRSEPAELPPLKLPAPAGVRRDAAIERTLDGFVEQIVWYSVTNATKTDIHAFYDSAVGKIGFRADAPPTTIGERHRATFTKNGDISKQVVIATTTPAGAGEPIRVIVTFRYAIPR